MKFRGLTGVFEDLGGVVFLGQCFSELLFEFTLSSYKPRVMDVQGLCVELNIIIDQIEAGLVDKSRLEPVIDELAQTLKTDPVAKGLLDFDVGYYTRFQSTDKLSDLKIRLGLLNNKIFSGKYISKLIEELISVCDDESKKELIYTCARRLVSGLRTAGYSLRSIKEKIDRILYSEQVQIQSPGDLNKIFEQFSFEQKHFDVIFVAKNVMPESGAITNRFGAKIIDDHNDRELPLTITRLRVDDNDTIFILEDVRAMDKYSARDKAEKNLEHISDLFVLFHHRTKMRWNPEALVKYNDDWEFLPPPSSSVRRIRDNVPEKAIEKLKSVFENLSFGNTDSVGRFISVVRLHGSALEAASSEARIVNIWTALEVLVHRETASKLKAVIKLLSPFLLYDYIDNLIYSLAGDLYRWNRRKTSEILKIDAYKDWRVHHRLAAVLLGGDLVDKRNDLYELVSGYGLLRYRIFRLSELISDGKKIIAAVSDHEQRVVWQIKRIYRCRNLIVHDGTTPKYIESLTENAHEYLDIFIGRFLSLCTKQMVACTLEEAAEFQSNQYEHWTKHVRGAGKTVVDDIPKIFDSYRYN